MKIIEAKAEIIRPDLSNTGSIDAIYRLIEEAGRTCYKSKDKEVERLEKEIETIAKTDMLSNEEKKAEIYRLEGLLLDAKNKSARRFVSSLVKSGHEAMIEHANMCVRFTVDRGVSHELVRHRLASWAQESSRYCNYSKDKFGDEITVIDPIFYKDIPAERKLEIQNMFTKEFKHPGNLVDTLSDLEKRYADWFYSCYVAEASYLEILHYGAEPQEARDVLPTSTKTEVVMTANIREWRHFFKLREAGTTGKPHPQMVEVALPLLKKCQQVMPELFGDIEIPG